MAMLRLVFAAWLFNGIEAVVSNAQLRGASLRVLAAEDAGVDGLGVASVPPPVKKVKAGAATEQLMTQYPWADLAPAISKDDVAVGSGATCNSLYDKFCKSESPGMGRAATCLRQRLSGKAANMAEPGAKPCRVEVTKFFSAARKDITKYNAALAKSCKDELSTSGVCSNVATGQAGDYEAKKLTPFACLKKKKKKLSEACAAEVFQEQVEEAEDVRLDAGVMDACEADVKEHCDGVAPADLLSCLSKIAKKKNKKPTSPGKTAVQLQPECAKAVFGHMQEQSEDIRLNPSLFNTCHTEQAEFCGDEKFGEQKVRKCLFNKRQSSGFGEACKSAIEAEMGAEAQDARLNAALSASCDKDLAQLCPHAAAATAASEAAPDGTSVACLVKHVEEVQNKKCKREVLRVGATQSELWAANVAVESACAGDVARFCSGVGDTGSAVQDCLRGKLSDLSSGCKAAEFSELVAEAQSLELKPSLLRSCQQALQQCVPECGDEGWSNPEGASCALKCLNRLKNEAADSTSSTSGTKINARCSKQVSLYDVVASSDYRLMPGVPDHCGDDMQRLCAKELETKGNEGEGPAGVVLECLVERVGKVRNKACKQDVQALRENKAAAPESDAHSVQACKQDAALFCPQSSEGPELHECLQRHVSLLDPPCLHVEFEATKAATEDAAFNPKLKKACRAVIGGDDSSSSGGGGSGSNSGGRGNKVGACAHADTPSDVLTCLEDLHAQMGISSNGGKGSDGKKLLPDRCVAEVAKLVKLKNKDYRLGGSQALATTCGADIGRLCAKEAEAIDASEALGDGRVVDCLVDLRDEVREPSCSEAVKRKMLDRVLEATNDPAMARDCGPEIEALCFDSPPGEGNLHRCLFVDHYNYLSETCKERELKYQAMKRSSVSLNPLLEAHCQPVLDKYCARLSGTAQSQGTLSAQMKCLEEHVDSVETTPACRSRVLQEPILRSKSLLLNPDVSTACAADFTELFQSGRCFAVGLLNLPKTPRGVAKELGGRDISCLLKNENRVGEVCAKSLLSVKRARAKDLRANPGGGIEVCKGDIERFCADKAYGSGAVNRCLQDHLGLKEPMKLSEKCSELQTDIRLDEARDFLANPLMEIQCANEREAYCSSLVDGNSRIQTCLSNKLDDIVKKQKAAAKKKAGKKGRASSAEIMRSETNMPGFSSGCARELQRVWITAELAEAILSHPVSRQWVFWSKHAVSLRWLHGANVVWGFKVWAAVVLVMLLWFAFFTERTGPHGTTQLGPCWLNMQRKVLGTCLDHNAKGERNA